MALKDIVSQKDLIAEANRTRQKRVEEGNKARAEQKEEARKANYLRRRREGNNIAYQQFKRSGTEAIDTGEDQGAIDKFIFGEVKNDPKYQAAREMKKALESERARVNIPDVLDEVRKSGETSLNKAIPMTKEDAEVINSKEFKKASEATMDKKKGGMIKKMASGGKVSSASKRADGIAVKGKTRGKIC
jgi:hypothetical protein